MIVSMHQANFLPGVSVVSKFAASHLFVICDEMEYTRDGFVNRNRFSPPHDGWMTVPINRHDSFSPINRVRINDRNMRARKKIAKTLQNRMGDAAEPFVAEVLRPYQRLCGLNVALLRILLDGLGIRTPYVMQSHLATGNNEANVSERICAMAVEVGATVYLSGPSGRKYLDETPFYREGIKVNYWSHTGPNPTAAELLCDKLRAVA